MRYSKGSQIEVYSKREVSSGSWRPAEIISGNGHTYTVKYDRISADQPLIGWVSRKAIRPQPPPLEVTNWVSTDNVEVFDGFSWKLATILKELGMKHILVQQLQLHGSLKELEVKKRNIRVTQSWEDGKWTVIGKQSLNCEDGKHLTQTGFIHDLKSLSPCCNALYQSSEIAAKKYRFVEEGGEFYRAMENPLPSFDFAYTVASERALEGKKRARASLIIRIPVMLLKNEVNHSAYRAASLNSADSNAAGTDLCSVGSCSTTNSLRHIISTGPADDRYDDLSDAESSNAPNQYEEERLITNSREEAAAAEIHRLELHSYRCTLRALHASGPLSWEQQSLISNLRLSLNISNDEHLMELKNLLSRNYETY